MTPYYRPACIEDAHILAPKMRKQDVEEVKASSGLDPLEALLLSMEFSDEVYAIVSGDEEVIGLFGVTPTEDSLVGCPWLLASKRLPEVSKEFIPQSLVWVKEINTKYPILRNYVDARNRIAIRWLGYLGFTFINLIEDYGVGRIPFYEFVRIEAN
jgi:hypothetical protein